MFSLYTFEKKNKNYDITQGEKEDQIRIKNKLKEINNKYTQNYRKKIINFIKKIEQTPVVIPEIPKHPQFRTEYP